MIELRNVSKQFSFDNSAVTALNGVNLFIQEKEFVAITGPSGSGKSTLLAILGCLDKPSSGEYLIFGEQVHLASEKWLAHLRNKRIGFVFQQFNLIPRFNALENVELPMIYADINRKERQRRAAMALKAVGLAERARHRPAELSGGQQQRVAIARALVNNPDIILADEPTGSLDDVSSHEIMTIFRQLHAAGKTIIFITHNSELISYATRVLQLENGKVFDAAHTNT